MKPELGFIPCCSLFSADPIPKSGLGVLLIHITVLKDNIIGFLADLQPFITATPRKDVVESLFIVDSLLSNLEDLLYQDDLPNLEDILSPYQNIEDVVPMFPPYYRKDPLYLEESWNLEDETKIARFLSIV